MAEDEVEINITPAEQEEPEEVSPEVTPEPVKKLRLVMQPVRSAEISVRKLALVIGWDICHVLVHS